MTDARERLRDQGVADAIRRIASGSQPLTQAQLSWVQEAQASLALKPAELKVDRAQGPDRTKLILEAMKKAGGMLRQAIEAESVPEGVRALLRETLEVLEEGTGHAEEKAARRATAFIEAQVKGDRENTPARRGLLKLTAQARTGKLP